MASRKPLTVRVEDVCFCHWPVDPDELARAIPCWLTVERAADDAWITAIHHTVAGVSAFGVDLGNPAQSVTVRTYVRGPDGQRGLYFFAAFTTDPIASAAGPLLRLDYRDGRVARRDADGDYRTERALDVDGRRALTVRYTPGDEPATTAPPDSLPAFFVERFRVFGEGPLGARVVGHVGHDPWELGPVESAVDGDLLSVLGLPEPVGDPLVHYSPGNELGVAPFRPLWLD
ncbi:DUF2071 domain-containing protein [Haloarcula onubensis]|uniref:DUF2071 domain-containing protein n=1 Tax=Haloarcula onubensis TaxID=2950539 RepID=A0ABU2FLP6_9EURY|nr:DUF2071 domain-containing protein [Halomicroarcula sp. S3CR25-11]MDS0281688.1 DUF2071 domain-containing protein [Halomicroarcula sp. S3CR25-11]